MKKDKTLIFLDKLLNLLDENYFFNCFYDYNNYGLKDYAKWYEEYEYNEDFNKIKKEVEKLIKEYVKQIIIK